MPQVPIPEFSWLIRLLCQPDKHARRSRRPADSETGTWYSNRKNRPWELFQELAGLDHRGYLSSIRGRIQIFLSTIYDRTLPPLLRPHPARFRFSRSRFRRSNLVALVLPPAARTFLDADQPR